MSRPRHRPPPDVLPGLPGPPTGRRLGSSWSDRAACRGEDPELFFPVGTDGPAMAQTAAAKAICRRCPIITTCLNWAIDHRQDTGIWGGTDEHQRRVLHRHARSSTATIG